jgi:predicted NBD/HSP70 family sugar kinase
MSAPSRPRAGSAGHILRLLREQGPLTRQELQAEFGLSRVTMVERIDALQRLRLLRQAGYRQSGGGRPAELLAADEEGRAALVVDVGASHAAVAVADLRTRILAEHRLDLPAKHRPQDTLPLVLEIGRALLDETGRAEDLCAVGLSVPGQIDREEGTTIAPAHLREWSHRRLDEPLRDEFSVPVLLENDANALTFGEYLATGDRNATVLGVKVGTAIGAGVVISGVPYQGMTGCAGEIGHIRIEGRSKRCTCGRRGCVAALASGRALLQALRPSGARSLKDVARWITEGRPDAVELATDAGRLVGTVLATVVSILNPKRMRVGGAIGALPPFVAGIRDAVHEQAHPVALHGLDIEPAVHGPQSALIGLAGLVADSVFDPSTVDAKL